MKHHCHNPVCRKPCPPRHLMCGPCWATVPAELQRDVYRTVKLRGGLVDESWAPWWRAQARAIDAALEAAGADADKRKRLLDHELAFADELEERA